jgi:hypothetical protein
MRFGQKIAGAAIIAAPILILQCTSLAAQTGSDRQSAAMEASCDYCGDFTDVAVGAGPVQTAYVAGIGYSDNRPPTQATAECSGTSTGASQCARVADRDK